MLGLRRPILLAFTLVPFVLFVVPTLAVAQEATPTLACPSGEFPSAGALDITDGTVLWGTCSPDKAYRTVIGASDQVVLIQENGPRGQDQRTIALDPANGSERWRRPGANTPMPSGPVDGMGVVVLATAERDAPALIGVDSLTGEELWRVASSDVPFAHSATVAVVWDWDRISNFGEGQFRGIDRGTGDELWVSDTPFSDPSQSAMSVGRSPAVVLGDVIVVPTGTAVTAIDTRTGATLWTAPHLDSFSVTDDGIIVGNRGEEGPNAAVTALDAASGEQLWTAPGHLSYGGFLAVGGGVVAVLDSTRAGVVAYEVSSGTERWRAPLTPFAEPQLISGTSLVLLWEGQLAVMSTSDGATMWSVTQPFKSPLMNSVGSNGDAVFVAINSLPWGD
jgi:outer membrane protein assembly factor BamB